MSTFTVQVQVPTGLRDLGYSDDDIRREIPVLLVLQRFRKGAISSSKAARILDMSRREFLDILTREGIPLFDPSQADLEEELKTVRSLETN